jgi:ectoine hydroxylase
MKLTPDTAQRVRRTRLSVLPELLQRRGNRAAARRCRGDPKLDRQEVWREKTGAPRTAFAAHTLQRDVSPARRHPRVVEPLRQLFGEDVYVHQFKLNAKAAFEGDVWQWHQDYGTWARDDGMPEPRAMNIAVFLDEVMPINGPLMLIPKSHKQGVLSAGHDTLTTSYPLWTLDKETVTRLAAEGGIVAPTGKPGGGADVPRQSGARLAAQHHALSAQDRLSDAVRRLQPHHQVHPAGMDRASRFSRRSYARAHRSPTRARCRRGRAAWRKVDAERLGGLEIDVERVACCTGRSAGALQRSNGSKSRSVLAVRT